MDLIIRNGPTIRAKRWENYVQFDLFIKILDGANATMSFPTLPLSLAWSSCTYLGITNFDIKILNSMDRCVQVPQV